LNKKKDQKSEQCADMWYCPVIFERVSYFSTDLVTSLTLFIPSPTFCYKAF